MSFYTPVKYALIIILTVGLVVTLMELVPELQRHRSNSQNVVIFVIELIVILIGLAGSWRDNRQMLLTFAIILTVIVIVSVVNSQAVIIIGNAVLNIISIVLAVYQSEMIRSGYL